MENENNLVEFLLKGESFNERHSSLHDMIIAYSSFESIFDDTFANIIGISRFSKNTRDDYVIRFRETRRSSLNSLFEIFIAISPALFGGPLTVKDLLETVKATYDFIKCAYTLKKSGDNYEIINNTGNVQINSTGNQYVFNAPVAINLVQNAQDILPDIRQLADLIKSSSLSEFNIKSMAMSSPIELRRGQENLFDLEEEIATDTKEISVEFYRYNKRSRTGKLQIHPLQEIPEGKVSFFIKDKSIQDDLILSMLKTSTTVVVREYYSDDPVTGRRALQHLEIVDI